MIGEPLKLRAVDAEDVQVVSAVLQDSIVPVCDMVFQPETQSFILVAQRLRREYEQTGACERICCALTIKGVTAVQTHGIDPAHPARMLDMLALMIEAAPARLTLVFAGDAQIRLELREWSASVLDFGEPWPVLSSPCHEAGAG